MIILSGLARDKEVSVAESVEALAVGITAARFANAARGVLKVPAMYPITSRSWQKSRQKRPVACQWAGGFNLRLV
jgi:hypothetical protein